MDTALTAYREYKAQIDPIFRAIEKACHGPVLLYNELCAEHKLSTFWLHPNFETGTQVWIDDDGTHGVAVVGHDDYGCENSSCLIPEAVMVPDYEPIVRDIVERMVAEIKERLEYEAAREVERRAGRLRILRGELSTDA